MTDDDIGLDRKQEALREWLRQRGSVLIAFSGGVDSTLLLKLAVAELGERVLAVTARSETYPQGELDEARALAAAIGARHVVIETCELQNPQFQGNPPDRCYYCKDELFSKLATLAREHGLAGVCDGTNVDDFRDHRPGRRAARQHGVLSPLADCGFAKNDIRVLSQRLGLPTWNKPAYACLASRFPYGESITGERLTMVDRAEQALREFELGQLRVRYHREVARIEVAPAVFETVVRNAPAVVEALKACGFRYVTLDLQGYRTGSMNEVLANRETQTGT